MGCNQWWNVAQGLRDLWLRSAWGETVFLEKRKRYFRRYEFTFFPRHKGAPQLPIFDVKKYNIFSALAKKINGEAREIQPNGDIVDLIDVVHSSETKTLTLLFHRASPGAADPAYRTFVESKEAKSISIRKTKKRDGEHQSVSAHLVISSIPRDGGIYDALLEEVPGISMSVIHRIVGGILRDYSYSFTNRGKSIDTYAMFKPAGRPSESLTSALKEGKITGVTLTKKAKADFIDGDGIFSPQTEEMKLRVTGEIDSKTWRDVLPEFMRKTQAAGWPDFRVDLHFEDTRSKVVKIDNDKIKEGEELYFVRSEEVSFKEELDVCVAKISTVLVSGAIVLFDDQ